VVALGREQGMQLVPGADTELEAGAEMLLIGSIDAEERFLELFPSEGPVAA
jgi:Trk K+ transport system NAD-binding subunit